MTLAGTELGFTWKDLAAGVVVLQKPKESWKITVYDCKLYQIVQPIAAAVLKVVPLLGTLVSGMELLIW